MFINHLNTGMFAMRLPAFTWLQGFLIFIFTAPLNHLLFLTTQTAFAQRFIIRINLSKIINFCSKGVYINKHFFVCFWCCTYSIGDVCVFLSSRILLINGSSLWCLLQSICLLQGFLTGSALYATKPVFIPLYFVSYRRSKSTQTVKRINRQYILPHIEILFKKKAKPPGLAFRGLFPFSVIIEFAGGTAKTRS